MRLLLKLRHNKQKKGKKNNTSNLYGVNNKKIQNVDVTEGKKVKENRMKLSSIWLTIDSNHKDDHKQPIHPN